MWFIFIIYPVGLLSIALIIPLSKYFYDIYPKLNPLFYNDNSTRLKFYFYTAINLLIITVWIQFAVESSPLQNTVSDYGAPYGGVLLLLLIPFSFIFSYLIKSNNNLVGYYRYITLSKLLWVLSLIPGSVVVLFYGLIMFTDR